MMDEVTQAVENLRKEWSQAVMQLKECLAANRLFGELGKGTEEANSFPRLNGDAQDTLKLLKLFQFELSLLVPQLPNCEEMQSGQATLRSWKEQYHKLHMSLRSVNFQAKANIRKSPLEEGKLLTSNHFFLRELLLGGGEESTVCRTKAGMTSAAESNTNSLRLSRQLMVQMNQQVYSGRLKVNIMGTALF